MSALSSNEESVVVGGKPSARTTMDDADETIILDALHELGVDVFVPETRRQKSMAEALEAFSYFVLESDQRDACREILERHLDRTVGHLQGGSETDEIYRVSITDDCDSAAHLLLHNFHTSSHGQRYVNILTFAKLQDYMRSMCDRRRRRSPTTQCWRLGNLMLVLSFGPVPGQVRHIDAMAPNVQICLYMSTDCPTTRIYAMQEVGTANNIANITSSDQLITHWEESTVVPRLIKTLLLNHAARPLRDTSHTKYFAFWDTIDTTLQSFGKLYQSVQYEWGLSSTTPGTTLIAGGIEVHAGPATVRPRMFAFAIGIPEDDTSNGDNNDDMDGEVQYSPVLLHIDFCCLIFAMLEYEVDDNDDDKRLDDEIYEAKLFLVQLLVHLMESSTCPKQNEPYHRLLGNDRAATCDWLGQLAQAIDDEKMVENLVEQAIASDFILFSPDVSKKLKKRRHSKKKKKRVHLKG